MTQRMPIDDRVRFLRRAKSVAIGLLLAAAAGAQLQTGGLYGTFVDAAGKPLPGVHVTLSRPAATPLQRDSGAEGQLRVLGLEPGSYELHAELQGFDPVVAKSIAILAGRNTALQVKMSPLPGETISVTAEPPELSTGKFAPVLTVGRFELEKVPTARDPWAVVAQAPGVLMSGVNNGGSESGQQLEFVGPGSTRAQNAFQLDGVTITDMAAAGSSPGYFDFDQFAAVTVSSGVPDATVASPGVTLSMVTKRGFNDWRGSARYYLTDRRWEAQPAIDPAELAPGQAEAAQNVVRRVADRGAEAGGPLQRDRLWLWASAGGTGIDRRSYGGAPVDIALRNEVAKLNFAPSAVNSGELVVSRGDKVWDGRGASPSRAPETLWRQHGPLEFFKLEDTQLWGGAITLTGMASRVDGSFELNPRGGSQAETVMGADGVYRGSFADESSRRNTREWKLDGAGLFEGARVSQEVTLGVGSRHFFDSEAMRWGPRNLIFYDGAAFGTPGTNYVEADRLAAMAYDMAYSSLWLQDSIKRGALSFSFGLRWDQQDGSAEAGNSPANPAFPQYFPAIAYPGQHAPFSWNTLSPRLGLTWALDSASKTVLSLAAARFPSQLHVGILDRVSPLYAYADFTFKDENGDHIYQAGEPYEFVDSAGFDPGNPGSLVSLNRTDPGLRPETTDALYLDLRRQEAGRWRLGLNLSYRRVSGILESRSYVRTADGTTRLATRDDYVKTTVLGGSLPDGTAFSAPVYSLAPGLSATGGRLLTNGDRQQIYKGATFSLQRAMSNGWMVRGHLTLSDWRWQIGPQFRHYDDPTDAALAPTADGFTDGADTNGEVVAEQPYWVDTTGALFLNSRWSAGLTGAAQVAPERPWGFNLAGNLSAREGFPIPYAVQAFSTWGRSVVQVTRFGDSYRGPDVYTFDLRLDKDLHLGDAVVNVGLDAFNLFNRGTVLQRARLLDIPRANYVVETMSPRVLRLGVRLSWR